MVFALILRLSSLLAIEEVLSVTTAEILKLPAAEGVPVIEPFVFNVSPAGAEPDHWYGGDPPDADKLCEYVVPTVPAGRAELVVIVSVAGLIVMAKARLAVPVPLSFTVAVKLKLPAAEGVPVIEPLAASVSPAGAEPDHWYGGEPPDADKLCEYVVPTVPAGRGDPVVIVSVAGLIVMAKARLAVPVPLSFTVAVKLKLPAAEGVPVIEPLAASVSPAGAEPDHWYGGDPPDADKLCEYVVPTVPAGRGELVVIVSVAGLIVMANARLVVPVPLSFTVAVKLKLPAAEGVPVIEPLAASVSPSGAEPDHWYGGDPPDADKLCEYVVPTVPAGRAELVVIVSVAGLIVMAKARLAVPVPLSFTVAVKLKLPAAVGVPVIEPFVFKVSPAGAEPDHWYGGEPPDADKLCEYVVPTVPAGRGEPVVIVSVAGLIVMAKARLAVPVPLSFTVAVKLKLPAAEGVPVIEPLAASVSPAGAEPDHWYGGEPPDAARLCEYVAPTVPAGRGDPVVIVSVAGLIVMANARLAVPVPLSFTVAVKLKLPAAEGVPVIEPLAASVSPSGAEPDHWSGGDPPDADKLCEYVVPTVPAGRGELVVIVSVAGLIVMAKARLAVPVPLSFTVAVKLKLPAAEGVPVTEPFAFNVSPSGAEPDHR